LALYLKICLNLVSIYFAYVPDIESDYKTTLSKVVAKNALANEVRRS